MLMKKWGWLAAVLACIWQVPVHAVEAMDTQAIQQAFEQVQIVLQDTYGAEAIPYSDTPWRIVEGENVLDALASQSIVAQGVTDKKGVLHLDKPLRQKIYDIWQRQPERLWLIENSHAFLFQAIKNTNGYQIALVVPEADWEKERRLASEEAARNRLLPIPPETYTQAGFDAKRFEQDFSDWQARFRQDVSSVAAQLAEDPNYVRKLLQAEDTTALDTSALKQTFAQSIDADEKGLSLRQTLLSAYLAGPATEGTEVTPSGKVMMDLLLSKNAKPVGFGGAFMDLGLAVHLWYMVFDDMTTLNQQDLKESLIFKGFSPLSLPAYEVPARDSWPALVFSHHEGSLKLYGMSREMARILQTIQNAQLF